MMDANRFKRIVGSFPAGVTVVTAAHEGAISGMTVSSFVSLSLDPLLVGVCLRPSKDTARLATESGRFVVNILSHGQAETSNNFAFLDEADRFVSVSYRASDYGPVLDNVLAYLECDLVDTLPAGDHVIYVGRTEGGDFFPGEPLIYHRSRYL